MDPILSQEEIEAITGGYKRPGDQLRELHAQGFFRARIGRVTGKVILERPHYDAVATGQPAASGSAGKAPRRPKVRVPQLRAVT